MPPHDARAAVLRVALVGVAVFAVASMARAADVPDGTGLSTLRRLGSRGALRVRTDTETLIVRQAGFDSTGVLVPNDSSARLLPWAAIEAIDAPATGPARGARDGALIGGLLGVAAGAGIAFAVAGATKSDVDVMSVAVGGLALGVASGAVLGALTGIAPSGWTRVHPPRERNRRPRWSSR